VGHLRFCARLQSRPQPLLLLADKVQDEKVKRTLLAMVRMDKETATEIRSLAAEMLALNGVVTNVLHRIAQTDFKLADAISLGFAGAFSRTALTGSGNQPRPTTLSKR
jgi:hypothetical protein